MIRNLYKHCMAAYKITDEKTIKQILLITCLAMK